MVVLDFAGVEFISRGFADQLHKERLAFQERCGVHVVFDNTGEDVQRMMQAVALTQGGTVRSPLTIPIIRVKDVAELQRMLMLY